MKKTVLLYNFKKPRLQLVKRALLPLGCDVKIVTKKDYAQSIGYLLGEDGFTENKEKSCLKGFSDEMIVMNGFGSEMIDVLIAVLKKEGVGKISLKAVVTKSNINWNSITLYNSVKADHDAINNLL